MAWDVADVDDYFSLLRGSYFDVLLSVARLLPWNPQIKELIVFNHGEDWDRDIGPDIIGFDAVKRIEDRNKYSKLDLPRRDISPRDTLLEYTGTMLIDELEKRASKSWGNLKHLSREERTAAIEKILNQVRIAYKFEKADR
ncbi:hypothetical protein NHQ30_002079 [Ciborinia camelliae]|nr:hypothetical protein NHQ30_002079 [Ciborinia camelliae]